MSKVQTIMCDGCGAVARHQDVWWASISGQINGVTYTDSKVLDDFRRPTMHACSPSCIATIGMRLGVEPNADQPLGDVDADDVVR